MGMTTCTYLRQSSHAAPIIDKPRVHSIREIITKSEIARTQVTTAYDLITRLRPEYLGSPAARETSGAIIAPVVYINGSIAGDVAVLRGISTDMIVEIRYVPPRDAITYHGQSHRGGEIMVYTYAARGEQRPI